MQKSHQQFNQDPESSNSRLHSIENILMLKNNLPPISSSTFNIAAKTSASKLLEEVNVICRVFLDIKGGFLAYLKDLHLLNSSESLLSGGASCTSEKLTGLSESAIIYHVS